MVLTREEIKTTKEAANIPISDLMRDELTFGKLQSVAHDFATRNNQWDTANFLQDIRRRDNAPAISSFRWHVLGWRILTEVILSKVALIYGDLVSAEQDRIDGYVLLNWHGIRIRGMNFRLAQATVRLADILTKLDCRMVSHYDGHHTYAKEERINYYVTQFSQIEFPDLTNIFAKIQEFMRAVSTGAKLETQVKAWELVRTILHAVREEHGSEREDFERCIKIALADQMQGIAGITKFV